MRNFTLLFFLVALSSFSFSQSKKEQIELLNIRIDSINKVLSAERKTSADKSAKITDLDSKIANLEKEKTTLNGTISKLNGEITSLNSSINQLKSELAATKSSLDNTNNVVASKNQEISNLTAQVKTKSDSLKLVQNELVKLKPAPKQALNSQNKNSLKSYSSDDIDVQDGKFIMKATNEIIDGIVYRKDKSGNILDETTFINGIPCGPSKSYYEVGKLSSEFDGKCNIDKGYCTITEGIHKSYHYNSRLKRKIIYKNEAIWEDRCYDENGDEIKPCPKNY